jgi:hypothetical protein
MRDMVRHDWAPRAVFITVEHLGNTAEAKARNRAGKSQTVIRGTRNGLPQPRYRYRGNGTDQLLGTYGDEWLDKPCDW